VIVGVDQEGNMDGEDSMQIRRVYRRDRATRYRYHGDRILLLRRPFNVTAQSDLFI